MQFLDELSSDQQEKTCIFNGTVINRLLLCISPTSEALAVGCHNDQELN